MKRTPAKPLEMSRAGFDFQPARRMVRMQEMKSKSLKAARAFVALAAFSLALGCETTAEQETVPTSVSTTPTALPQTVAPAAVVAPVAQTNGAAVATTNATVAAQTSNVSTNAPDDDSGTVEAVAPTLPANIRFSEPVKEIVKLGQSTVDDAVLLAFVSNVKEKFDLDANEILYLHDVGIPSNVIAEMLKKDGQDPKLAEVVETNPDAATLAEPATNAAPAQPVAAAAVQAAPPAPTQQQVEVTTNYIPNTAEAPAPPQQQVVVQQPAQTTVVYTTPQPASVTYFYDSLSPYGTWHVVPEYGWVWQPSVAVIDPGWRPYGPRGRWVWTSAGWYWHSDYSWGWAPFHYGRWYMSSHRGWVWVPDMTWGPSWVTWRYSTDYCGWAPLPPAAYFHHGVGFTYYGSRVGFSFGFGLGYDRFCFVPTRHFYHHRPWHHHVPHHHTRFAYERSRPMNRWEFRGHDHFVNHGPGRDHVERHTGRRLHEVAIKDNPPAAGANSSASRRERFVSRGGDTSGTIYRPTPPRSTTQVADTMASRRGITRANYSDASGRSSKDPIGPTTVPGSVDRGSSRGQPGATPSGRTGKPDVSPRVAHSAPQTQTPSSGSRVDSPTRTIPGGGMTKPGTAPAVNTPSRRDATPAPTQPSRRDYSTPRTQPQAQPSAPATQPSRRDFAKPQTSVAPPVVSHAAPTTASPAPTRRDYVTPIPGAPSSSRGSVAQAPVVTAPAPATSPRSYTPAPAPTFQKPMRIETPSAPAPSRREYTPAPSYSAPPARSYSAPNYQAPAPSAPARSYSAPNYNPPAQSAPSRSYSAPNYNPPAQSAPSRSYSAPSSPGPSRFEAARGRNGKD